MPEAGHETKPPRGLRDRNQIATGAILARVEPSCPRYHPHETETSKRKTSEHRQVSAPCTCPTVECLTCKCVKLRAPRRARFERDWGAALRCGSWLARSAQAPAAGRRRATHHSLGRAPFTPHPSPVTASATAKCVPARPAIRWAAARAPRTTSPRPRPAATAMISAPTQSAAASRCGAARAVVRKKFGASAPAASARKSDPKAAVKRARTSRVPSRALPDACAEKFTRASF